MMSMQKIVVMLAMICLINVQACEYSCPLETDCSKDWTMCATGYCCAKVTASPVIYRCLLAATTVYGTNSDPAACVSNNFSMYKAVSLVGMFVASAMAFVF